MNSFNQRISFGMLLIAAFTGSCKKLVEVPPPSDQIVSPVVFSNDATASATISGIYARMISYGGQFTGAATTLYAGMSADELEFYAPGATDQFTKNELSPLNGTLSGAFWQPAYRYIYTANLCIEQLTSATTLTPSLKNQLTGEARFIRAFCYFYLVQFFGEVPLITTSNYIEAAFLPRTNKMQVMEQVVTDLNTAINYLSTSYVSSEKTRPNKWTAAALLARAYLYQQNWQQAAATATQVIDAGIYTLATDVNDVFLKNSSEAIWQLRPVDPQFNTWEGYMFHPPSPASSPTYLVTPSLYTAFETGDRRKDSWTFVHNFAGTDFVIPDKYKVFETDAPLDEYYMVFRLAEMFLIRAEANAWLGKLPEAKEDIDLLRARAGLSGLPAIDKPTMLLAIEHERRIELFAEWGHRWFDLNRTGRSTTVLGALKPSTWQPTDMLWPIPQSEINLNQALQQNPGY